MSIPTAETLPRLEREPTLAQWARELVTRLETHISLLRYPEGAVVLVSGNNNNVNVKQGILIRIVGPSGAFTITGIGNGNTGQILVLYNTTNQSITIANQSASSALGNRILTMTGADITVTGPSLAVLIYDRTQWLLGSLSPTPSSGGGGGGDTFARVYQSWTAAPSNGGATPTIFIGTVNASAQPTTQGTQSTVLNDTGGCYANYLSSTLASSVAGWAQGPGSAFGGIVTCLDWLPDFQYTMKTGAAATDLQSVRTWVDMNPTNGANTNDNMNASGGGIGFRFSSPAGDTNWQISTSDGAASNTIDTGVVVTTDTRYIFRIQATATTSVNFFINGNQVGTAVTTHLPPAGTLLMPQIYSVTSGAVGVGRNIKIRQIQGYSN